MKVRCSLAVVIVLLGLAPHLRAEAATSLAEGRQASASAVNAADSATAPSEEAIDFDRARALMQRRQRGQQLTPDEESYLRRAIEARRRGAKLPGEIAATPLRDTTGLKPLSEMSADDRYKGEDGGLYGGGPQRAARRRTAKAAEAATGAHPAARCPGQAVGRRHDRAGFDQHVQRDAGVLDVQARGRRRPGEVGPGDDRRLCARAARRWPNGPLPTRGPGRKPNAADRPPRSRPHQVQAAWVKLANKGPRGDLPEHGRKL